MSCRPLSLEAFDSGFDWLRQSLPKLLRRQATLLMEPNGKMQTMAKSGSTLTKLTEGNRARGVEKVLKSAVVARGSCGRIGKGCEFGRRQRRGGVL